MKSQKYFGELIAVLCVLSTCIYIYAAPTCVQPVLKTNQIGLCNPNGSVVLWECPACTPGSGLSVECGQVYKLGTKIDCVPCKKGVEYSSTHDIGQCKQCTKCHENEEETKSCKVDRDRSCTCKAEHYRDDVLKDCKPCSWCCGDDSDKHIPKCKATPHGKQCGFRVDKSCGPTTSISTTTVKTTATPVETTTSQGPLDTETKSQINETSYDSGNTAGTPDTGHDEKTKNLPLHVYLVVAAISLIVILVLVAVICQIFAKNSSPSTSSSAETSRKSSMDLRSSAPLLPQPEQPEEPTKDVRAKKNIQISTNNGTTKYIKDPEGKDGENVCLPHNSDETAPDGTERPVDESSSEPVNTERNVLRLNEEQLSLISERLGPKVVDLDYTVKYKISKMLNVQINGKDYRNLDKFCKLNHYDIKNLEGRENPMMDVFDTMISQTTTLKSFLNELQNISRDDVVQKLFSEIARDKINSVHDSV